MTNKRLEEIKDSIILQKIACKGNSALELVEEELELYNEVVRLNNVINKLEQWLKELVDSFDENVSEPIMHEQCTIRYVYDYLQYLKENDNEDN